MLFLEMPIKPNRVTLSFFFPFITQSQVSVSNVTSSRPTLQTFSLSYAWSYRLLPPSRRGTRPPTLQMAGAGTTSPAAPTRKLSPFPAFVAEVAPRPEADLPTCPRYPLPSAHLPRGFGYG